MIKPVSNDDVEIWFNMNNMVPEKRELFSDFTFSLYFLIRDTYLGDEFSETQETKVILSEEEKKNHFDWCWKKTIENFSKENVVFNKNGEHRDYFEQFFTDLFYNAEKKEIAENISKFFVEVFNENKAFTKSDLDMMTDIYKRLNKNLKQKN
jgi:DnaJ-class molecular chaperone